ncbi:Saccharopine dehydrogenase-domain-containing protein [Xylaria sp. FL1042]|nr:Saccharopine dehydrogenase-domain-containing protein [Xylaria sp. FL1042]
MPNTRPGQREYDILLIGATGYTGSLAVQQIARHFPADLRWVIAGRCETKLQRLRESISAISAGASLPDIEVINLSRSLQDIASLDNAVKRSRVCISVVTYFTVGEVVVESCVKNGTSYIDTMGDVVLLEMLVSKYHKIAENNGLIHAAGIFGGVHNLLTWAATRQLAENASLDTREVVLAMDSMKVSPSKGTVESFLHEASRRKEVRMKTSDPWLLSSIPGSDNISTPSNKMNMRIELDLGALSATSITAKQNQLLVHRSWNLLQGSHEEYGPNFRYNEYMRGMSAMSSLLTSVSQSFLEWLLGFKYVRNIVEKVLKSRSTSLLDQGPVVMEAVAISDAEINAGDSPRGHALLQYPHGPYDLTALVLTQGAASLLYSSNDRGKKGCLTTAAIAADLIERLRGAGVAIMLDTLHYNSAE